MDIRLGNTINWDELIKLRWRSDYWTVEIDNINEHWNEQPEAFGEIKFTPDKSTIHNAVMNFLKISDNNSVLDIASGPGKLTLPLSKISKNVTALDFSKPMFEKMNQYIKKFDIKNIKQCYGRFLELEVGKDYEVHDIAVACQCLGVISANDKKETKMKKCLINLNNSARDKVYIILPSMYSSLDPDFLKLYPTDKKLRIWTGEIEAFNLAHSLGYMPRIDYIPYKYSEVFEDFEEAVEETIDMMELEPFYKDLIVKYLETKLVKTESGLLLEVPALSQCIWWKKSENWNTGFKQQ